MAVSLSPLAGAGWQFFDNNGLPLAGGFLYTYTAGTSTPQATYTTSAGSVANANPIVLDSSGRTTTETWLTQGIAYKFILQTSAGVQIWSNDNVSGINDFTAIYSALSASTGSSLIGYNQGSTGAVTETVQAKLKQTLSVKDFGAKGDGTTDDTAAINAALLAISSGGALYFPTGTYKITSAITIPTHIKLYGDGSGSTKINCSGDGIYINTTSASSETYQQSIEGITLNGTSTTGTGITLTHAHFGTFIDVEVIGFNIGMYLNYSFCSSFYRCRFNSNNTGVQLTNQSNNVNFFGGSFNNNINTGITMDGVLCVNLIGVDVEYNGTRGIIIRGVQIGGNPNTSTINIIGCYIEENGTTANGRHITIGGSSSADTYTTYNVNIQDNFFYNSNTTMDAAITCYNCNGVLIENNAGLSSTFATSAIELYAGAQRILSRNNNINTSAITVLSAGATANENQSFAGIVNITTNGSGVGSASITLPLPYAAVPIVDAMINWTTTTSNSGTLYVTNVTASSFTINLTGASNTTTYPISWVTRGSSNLI